MTDCDQAINLDPTVADAYDSGGFARLKLGQWDPALTDFDKALELNPKLATALYGRGYAKLKKRDPTGDADVADARSLNPSIGSEFDRYGLH